MFDESFVCVCVCVCVLCFLWIQYFKMILQTLQMNLKHQGYMSKYAKKVRQSLIKLQKIIYSKLQNKMLKMYSPSGQDVDTLVSSAGMIWRNVASLAHQWVLCSEWVPSEWESKQLIKNKTIIHKTAVHQLTFCEIKSCVFVINKSVIKTFLALNCIQLKYCMSPLSIMFIFQWKSSIVWIRREICTDEAPFASETSPKEF